MRERPARSGRGWAALAAVAASPACPSPPPEPPPFCEGPTRLVYSPSHEGSLDLLPDDFWTLPDAATATGLRVHLPSATTPALAAYPPEYAVVFDHLSTLDGWGLTAAAQFRFDGPVDPASLLDGSAVFVAFPPGGGDPVLVDAELSTTDWDTTVLVQPRLPLPAGAQAAALLSTAARDSGGDCLAPSRFLREQLSPETELDEGVPPHDRQERFVAAVAAAGWALEDVAAVAVFTTQSAERVSTAVAADVAARDYALDAPLACAFDAARGWTECDGTLPVQDYRGDDGVVPADSRGGPLGSYGLPIRVWLPGDGQQQAPFPTIFYGHGLGGDRGQGAEVAERVAPLGVAVVSVDAVEHGDHPERTEAEFEFLEPLMFFGVAFDPPSLHGLRLRDNWRQSAWDKLQAVRAIEAGFDADGDGDTDLDASRMVYVGVSLGAIMGPELLALSGAFRGALLSVGGGRTAHIIPDSTLFSPIIDVMAPEGTTPGDVDRFFPLLQTLVDPGDAMVWAPHVLGARLDDAASPQVLGQFALNDEIVPNSANDALFRALGVPGVGREIWPVAGVEFVPGPLIGNLPSGGTAGVQQFDFVTDDDEPEAGPVPATHDNVTVSVEGWAAALQFLSAAMDGETAVLSDPYAPADGR